MQSPVNRATFQNYPIRYSSLGSDHRIGLSDSEPRSSLSRIGSDRTRSLSKTSEPRRESPFTESRSARKGFRTVLPGPQHYGPGGVKADYRFFSFAVGR